LRGCRTEVCSFSLQKIYPGHGIKYIRTDAKVFIFQSSKSKAYFLQKQKAAKFHWTVVYRRLHKKGQTEQTTRKRARRVQRVARSIEGTSLDVLKKKKNQKPEERAQAREAALKELKKRREVQKAERKERKAKTVGTAAPKGAQAKQKGATQSKGR
jgi:large subunit ribosomal protein L24e